jgi:hypothetical protein
LPPWLDIKATAFDKSVGDPPPKAIKPSQPLSFQISVTSNNINADLNGC